VNAAKWARLLTDADLRAEILELAAKCKSPVYGQGTAGKLLRAARREHGRREALSASNSKRTSGGSCEIRRRGGELVSETPRCPVWDFIDKWREFIPYELRADFSKEALHQVDATINWIKQVRAEIRAEVDKP
jgi:hypothetical protein